MSGGRKGGASVSRRDIHGENSEKGRTLDRRSGERDPRLANLKIIGRNKDWKNDKRATDQNRVVKTGEGVGDSSRMSRANGSGCKKATRTASATSDRPSLLG